MINCPTCNAPVPDHERTCPTCNEDVGFPNVRAAQTNAEHQALLERVKTAEQIACTKGCQDELQAFRNALKTSVAVICRDVDIVKGFVSSDYRTLPNFYTEVEAGIRIPENNFWDRARAPADEIFFRIIKKIFTLHRYPSTRVVSLATATAV